MKLTPLERIEKQIKRIDMIILFIWVINIMAIVYTLIQLL